MMSVSMFSKCIYVCIEAEETDSQMKQGIGNAHGQHVTVGQCCFESDWAERQYDRSFNGGLRVTVLLSDATQDV
jgi:hypothetical protein